jgi:hypothetical protein
MLLRVLPWISLKAGGAASINPKVPQMEIHKSKCTYLFYKQIQTTKPVLTESVVKHIQYQQLKNNLNYLLTSSSTQLNEYLVVLC